MALLLVQPDYLPMDIYLLTGKVKTLLSCNNKKGEFRYLQGKEQGEGQCHSQNYLLEACKLQKPDLTLKEWSTNLSCDSLTAAEMQKSLFFPNGSLR
jgi:hypothetical protein